MEARNFGGRAKDMLTVSGHCRNATAKFSHLGSLQDWELVLNFNSCRTKHLDIERHVLDIETGPERLHVEKSRCFFVDTPKQATFARARIHGGIDRKST